MGEYLKLSDNGCNTYASGAALDVSEFGGAGGCLLCGREVALALGISNSSLPSL